MYNFDKTDIKIVNILLEDGRMPASEIARRIGDISERAVVHPGGAQALYHIKPDLTTLGKVIGGGLPVGAYGGDKDIMQLVAPAWPMYQAGTLSGNPLAMTAGIETLQELRKPAA